MDPDKAGSIVNWPRLMSQTEVQQLLGLWNFYQRFIPSCPAIVAPITDSLRGNKMNIHWGESQEAVFFKIIIVFSSGKIPIIQHYNLNQPALLDTNTSDFAIGRILWQKFEDGKIYPVGH